MPGTQLGNEERSHMEGKTKMEARGGSFANNHSCRQDWLPPPALQPAER